MIAENKQMTKLRRLMKRNKLTSTTVAELIGCQPQSVRQWMCGLRPVPDYALKIIELTYGQ
jgi:transcriptional regulator with XRE-family HTH domain